MSVIYYELYWLNALHTLQFPLRGLAAAAEQELQLEFNLRSVKRNYLAQSNSDQLPKSMK